MGPHGFCCAILAGLADRWRLRRAPRRRIPALLWFLLGQDRTRPARAL